MHQTDYLYILSSSMSHHVRPSIQLNIIFQFIHTINNYCMYWKCKSVIENENTPVTSGQIGPKRYRRGKIGIFFICFIRETSYCPMFPIMVQESQKKIGDLIDNSFFTISAWRALHVMPVTFYVFHFPFSGFYFSSMIFKLYLG